MNPSLAEFVALVTAHRVFAILRHVPAEQLPAVLDALVAGGIRLLEITMNTQDAAGQLSLARVHLGDRAILGAGTVTTPARAVALKLFPAGQLGTGYIRDVRAALDDAPLVAVGGVTVENAADWIRAGCIGVGIGGSLLDKSLLAAGDMAGLAARARALTDTLAGV